MWEVTSDLADHGADILDRLDRDEGLAVVFDSGE